MLKDLSFDEIQTYFKELDTKENSKFLKAQMYSMAKRDAERTKAENEIKNIYKSDYLMHVNQVTMINDNLSVVEVHEVSTDKVWFFPIVNMKKLDCAFYSLDTAIIYGIAYKNKCDDYANAAIKLITKDKEND